MDVMVFQKVYCTFDYKYPKNLKAIKILDVCDIDWYTTPDIYIKETLDVVDGVAVPTESLQAYLQQMTTTPVRVIKDRFDLEELPTPKKHVGRLTNAVWFGYTHNAELVKTALNALVEKGIRLTILANDDPLAYRWAREPEKAEKLVTFKKYEHPQAYQDIKDHDIVVLPKGHRPQDKFKSENKAILAQLLGVPVVTNLEELEQFSTAEARNEHINAIYDKLKLEYDCKQSIREYKDFIDEIKRNKT
jgi:FMN phosphatase YigB (HAD superfamily)